MSQLPSAVCFSGKSLSIIDRDGTPYLSARELARALGYADERSVLRIYARRADEFTEQMTCVVKLTPQGEQARDIRLFSPRGCHMVSMFARTSVAAAFRRWVLDVLEVLPSIRKTGSYVSDDTVSLTTVRRCGTVVGKEIKNSELSGTRIRKPCGFFTPARFTSGGRQPYNTRKGKAARRLSSVFDLPTPTGAARKNVSPWSSDNSGDVL
ncbi:BRO-N domain-containing protein [Xylella fastidiosa]|uniref:BRO-N domain-containing protein n=1 Tax=Xylella fastidiosa TaxID=2371 RepID=UPI0002144249|nr:BRO family protein [Xylella fastidiosa]EGO80834.1 Prophage antirepressor [Xylella fastidiosa EB92.1]